jgi:hypothetical protein
LTHALEIVRIDQYLFYFETYAILRSIHIRFLSFTTATSTKGTHRGLGGEALSLGENLSADFKDFLINIRMYDRAKAQALSFQLSKRFLHSCHNESSTLSSVDQIFFYGTVISISPVPGPSAAHSMHEMKNRPLRFTCAL